MEGHVHLVEPQSRQVETPFIHRERDNSHDDNDVSVPTRQFTHREFALTLANDAYLRYQSFSNADELKAEMLRLGPSRFEIGPMYSGRVNELFFVCFPSRMKTLFSIPSPDLSRRFGSAQGPQSFDEVGFQARLARVGV